MGIFGKSDDEKVQEDVARQNEARRKMEEALAHRAATAHPAPAPASAPAHVPAAPAGGVVTHTLGPAATTADDSEIYVVAKGDSLSKIAKHHLGNASDWHKIYEANRGVIGDNPDKIFPGQKLHLPKATSGGGNQKA